jgi:hypothetical protein
MSSDRKQVSAAAPRFERLLWVLPVVLSAWRYYPITQNYFFGDDLYNLYEIVNRSLPEYLFKPYGMHLLAARNLVYYLCFTFFGTNAEPYFWWVLLTHLVNVYLVFAILRTLSGPRMACVGAAFWGMSPIDEGALGWFSVYGQVQATTMILFVLYRMLRVANGAAPLWREPVAWAALLLIASVSFGSGIGAAMAFPVVAYIVLQRSPIRRRALWAFGAVAASLPLLYVGSFWLAKYYDVPRTSEIGIALGGLLALSRVLGLTAHMVAYGVTSLLLSPFQYPMEYSGTHFIVVPILALLVIVAGVAMAPAQRRRALLAAVVLGCACYGIIAVGRVGFFFFFGTKLVAAARYHYAAPLFFWIAILVAIATLAERWPLTEGWRNAAVAAALAILAIATAWRAPAIDHHPRERMLAMRAVARIRKQIDAGPPGNDVEVKNERFNGVGPMMLQRPDLFPGLAAIFAIYFPQQVVDGKRVLFVVDDEETLAAARQGRKTSQFVVRGQPPADAPAAPPVEAP